MTSTIGVVSGAFVAWFALSCASAPSLETRGPDPSPPATSSADAAAAAQPDVDGDVPDASTTERSPMQATPDGAGPELAETTSEVVLSDEPPYVPSARPRPTSAVAASAEDEQVARWNRGSGPLVPGRTSHPAPRIRIDVVEGSHKLDHSAVERVARSRGYWPIRLCYEEALRQAERLHVTLRIQITLLPSGTVQGTRITQSSSHDRDLLACIGHAFRKLALPTGARRTGVATLEISLWPGDAPVVRRAKDDPPLSLPVPSQDLTASLRRAWPEIKRCYGEGLRREPGLWGRMALELEIDAEGVVQSLRETESHFPRSEVTECVKRTLSGRRLSRPERPAHFVYAIRLGDLHSD